MFFARLALVVAAFSPTLAAQEEKLLPPPDRAPHLIFVHKGPHAPVTALAFSPEGNTLYVGGFDKQVRVCRRANGAFTPVDALRVPIGPGAAGVVNAVAVSPDGKWVAVAGRAPIRGENWTGSDSGFGEDFRRFPEFQKRDAGVVYLFDPANPNGGKVLRGQQAGVRTLAFANPSPASGPVLVTAGIEWSKAGEYSGTVRVFDVNAGKEIASRDKFPATAIRPGLAAWATGPKKDGLRVVVAWDDFDDQGKPRSSKVVTWDNPHEDGGTATTEMEGILISPLAVRPTKDGTAPEWITGGYDPKRNTGGLNVRGSTGAVTTTTLTSGGKLLLPTAIAAFTIPGTGDSTAALLPVGRGENGQRYELRVLTPKGEASVTRDGFHPQRPVLVASPDGRFLALGGFRDNRIEVFDTTTFAAKNPAAETLKGGEGVFSNVAFLEGGKMWLGGTSDTVEKGGVILDLDANARVARPRGAKEELKIDAPPGVEVLKATKEAPGRVDVTIAGVKKAVSVPPDEQVTAAVFLPGKPAWDAKLGPVVAVARFREHSQTVLVTIYDVSGDKPQPILHLDGPTLPIRSLAFSGSRPLLAAAGDDGTVTVWSLKGFTRVIPAVQDVMVTTRDGVVVVSAAPPKGSLKPDDVIESVANAKGVQQAVKTPWDFVATVRSLKPGDNAKVKVKRAKDPVEMPVGVAVGMRHPLVTLWVDPVANAKDGARDWIGWTALGPYDTNAERAEEHIGWITATGDPARPVSYTPAMQHRKTNYKPDFIRDLLETADLNASLNRLRPGTKPRLTIAWTGATAERNGRLYTRAKLEGARVSVNDPDRVLDYDRAQIQWRMIGPDGASEWKREPFTAGQADLDLNTHAWKRGEHHVQVRLLVARGADDQVTALDETVASVDYFPLVTKLAVHINGKEYASDSEIELQQGEVEVFATVETSHSEGALVIVSSTGTKPAELNRGENGEFGPVKVKLQDLSATVIRVTATNVGATDDMESRSVEVRVRQVPKDPPPPEAVPEPKVKLELLAKHDFHPNVDEPFIVRSRTVAVKATVANAKPLTTYEWVIDGKVIKGKLGADNTDTQQFTLEDDKPLTVQVRAQSANSPVGKDTVQVKFRELPNITVTPPTQTRFTSSEMTLSGGLKVNGERKFKVRVLVKSPRLKEPREFEPTPDATLTKWDARLSLYPGENWLGYVIKYDGDREEVRYDALLPVWYLRPPMIAAAAPIDAGAGAAGDLTLAAVSADVPPTELWVNNTRVGFQPRPTPLFLLGMPVWTLQARSVSVNDGEQRLKQLSVAVLNDDGASGRVNVSVLGAPPRTAPPPEIRLTYNGGGITEQVSPVGERDFRFDLRLISETPLTRVEVWHGVGSNPAEEVGRVNPAAGVAVPGGFELTAAPQLRLRPGLNRVRVIASNGGQVAEASFAVSYAPASVRVVIESIKEPNGAEIPVQPGSAGELRVQKGVIDVTGRVEWDFDNEPVGRDPNLSVVFFANGVAHLPVQVAPAKGGKVRKFTGRVYLNAAGNTDPAAEVPTRVRLELRSGGRPLPVPRQSVLTDAITVKSKEPIRRQRLHVVVIGVGVPESKRKDLIQRLVIGIGGELPKDNPGFTEGAFTRANFEFAYLYSPRLGYTKSGDLNYMLNVVRGAITDRSKRTNDEWVNDVVVVFYQGEAWQERDGRFYLHSATSLNGAAGPDLGEFAIRLDGVPQLPGISAAVAVVPRKGGFSQTLRGDLDFVLCAFEPTAEAGTQVWSRFGDSVKAGKTFGEVTKRWGSEVQAFAILHPLLGPDVQARWFSAR
jgi:WD40 repeat protein